MNKTIINIKGMHCKSCEILIEEELLKIEGIKRAVVSCSKRTAEIYYSNKFNENKVGEAIGKVGYLIGNDDSPLLTKNINDYFYLLATVLILLLLFFIAKDLNLFSLFNSGLNNFASLPVVLLIGLTAGLSTCMALVGGLILAASAKFAEKHPAATSQQKFKPHLYFIMGRITSYFLLGGVIGFAGSFFQISPLLLGILTIIVGLVMFLLGTQLIEISPRLKSISFTLPKSISKFFGLQNRNNEEYSHKNSIILGALTFFLPCGFTQAMQLYAISTGNPLKGALTMGVFAIGTAPGLLGIGGLTSVVKGAFAKSFFRFAGLVVIFLAIFNISNGINLAGITINLPFSASANNSISDPNVTLKNGIQIVKMTQSTNGYAPNTFTIKKGIPVKWIISSENNNTCAASIVSSKLGIRQSLNLGENIIEFTPSETGQIKFSCSMGMYNGVFNVIDSRQASSNPSSINTAVATVSNSAAGSSKAGGGGCGCGGGAVSRNLQKTASVTPIASDQQADVQVIKTTYTQVNDIQPNRFTVKAGKQVRMEIDVQENGYGCMGSITVPGFVQKAEVLTNGKSIVFNFTPTKPGDYNITCAMGVPRGVIKVI